MDYQLWKLFVDAYELGSLSKVAQSYRVSQPKISRQLNELEDSCHAKLFHRNGRGVILTDFGQALLPKIKSWLEHTEHLKQDILNASGDIIGSVRMGSIPSMSYPILTQVIQSLKQTYPKIELSVREGQGILVDQWLEEGSIDLGLLYRFNPTAHVLDDYLRRSVTYVIGHCEDALMNNARTIRLTDLNQQPLVTFCQPHPFLNLLQSAAQQHQMDLNLVFQVDSIRMQLNLIQRNHYYGLLGEQAVNSYLREFPTLTYAQLVEPELPRYLSLSLPPQAYLSPACKVVIQTIKKVLLLNQTAI
ncbi:MAG: LysR family transcriptional regulator [Acinetobacter sp.]